MEQGLYLTYHLLAKHVKQFFLGEIMYFPYLIYATHKHPQSWVFLLSFVLVFESSK